MMPPAVAITGIGVVSAFGHGVEPFWRALVAGETGVAPVRRFAARAGGLGAEVPPLDARAWATGPLGRRIDRVSLLALAAARLALADAGLAADAVAGDRTGLALGSACGNFDETESFLDRLGARGAANPLTFPNLVFNAPLSYATIELGITGPSAMLSAQETSGEAAIAHGAALVADGRVDVCLAGGVDELAAVLFEVLRETGALGTEPPRPFDPRARGAVPGEGAALFVLEPLARATARGARVYACIASHPGFAVPGPVHGWPTDPAPLAARLAPLVADADAIVAAACGVPARDGLEAAALAAALRGRRPAVTAPRAALGEFGAAGALAVAAAALAVAEQRVPPTVGVPGVAPHGLDVVRGEARACAIRVAVVDGIARGGGCRPIRLEAA